MYPIAPNVRSSSRPHSVKSTLQLLLQTRCVHHAAIEARLLGSGVLGCPCLIAHRWHRYPILAALLVTLLRSCQSLIGYPQLRYHRMWCLSDMGSESLDLIVDHFPHFAHIFDNLECEIKGSRTTRLVRSVVPYLKVAVFQCLFHADSSGRIKSKHQVQEVKCIRVGIAEKLLEVLLGHVWQIPNIFLRPWRSNTCQRLLVGGS